MMVGLAWLVTQCRGCASLRLAPSAHALMTVDVFPM